MAHWGVMEGKNNVLSLPFGKHGGWQKLVKNKCGFFFYISDLKKPK